MTRKRTIRQVWTKIDPIQHAIYQSAKLSIAEWNTQMMPVLSAVESLRMGDWAVRQNWQPLFEALSRIESMLKLKRMPDHGMIGIAQETYVKCLARMEETGATSFKADELAVIRDVAQVYGDLLKEVSHRELSEACKHANANIDRVVKDKRGIVNAGCQVSNSKNGKYRNSGVAA